MMPQSSRKTKFCDLLKYEWRLVLLFLNIILWNQKKELRWRKDNKKTNVTLKSSRFVGHKIFFKILITYISMMSKYNIKIQQVFIHYKLIRTGFTLSELISLVKVFRLFRLEWIFFCCSEHFYFRSTKSLIFLMMCQSKKLIAKQKKSVCTLT